MPTIVPGTEVFYSPDIGGGHIWLDEILDGLTVADFGIICVSKENRESRWLHFELGALWQRIGKKIPVCPLVMDLPLNRLQQPLAFFQARKFNKEGVWHICEQIVKGTSISQKQLQTNFEGIWPSLYREVRKGLRPLSS